MVVDSRARSKAEITVRVDVICDGIMNDNAGIRTNAALS